jgi:hypothetical protein
MKFEAAADKNKDRELPVPTAITWTVPSRSGINAPLKRRQPNTGGDLA